MKMDRARIQIGSLSRFGLLEMSRQRLRPSLDDTSQVTCPRCVGIGSIRSVESMTLAVLRLIGEELRKDRTARVIAQVPVPVATYLINEKREWLRTLETRSSTELFIVPNENLQTPDYTIRRVREDELEMPENKQATYRMPTVAEVTEPTALKAANPHIEAPAVATLLPSTSAPSAAPVAVAAAAPAQAPAGGGGFWSRFKKILAGEPAPVAPQPAAASSTTAPAREPRRDDGRRHDGRRDRGRSSSARHADGARRDRGDSRRSSSGGDRDRNRDGRDRDRDRNRDGGRRPERSGERSGERGGERSHGSRNEGGARAQSAPEQPPREQASRDQAPRDQGPRDQGPREQHQLPHEQVAQDTNTNGDVDGDVAPPATGAAGDPRGERGERSGRGRRGRRRGRRGGGGSRQGNAGMAAPEGGENAGFPGADSAGSESNGSHEGAAPQGEGEPAPVREYHSEPRESSSSQTHLPLAHFEPAPRVEPAGGEAKPYVVWSSAPADKGPGNRDQE
jgi:ribonuclease E